MSATSAEVAVMRRAIALAGHGLGSTSPNPPVGCVILDEAGEIVGEGFHVRKGEPHAEVQALNAAGERAQGGTAVVTLEPCNHHGRTPPCRQALIDAGVHRVVIAALDPTSREEGGAARLRSAGVEVEAGVIEHEAAVVLGPWLTALERKLPKVTWAYYVGPDSLGPVPQSLMDETALRYGIDAVVSPDGELEEGVPNAHALTDAFLLPTTDLPDAPAALLAALYASGTRSLLLLGCGRPAMRFLEAALIDEIRVFFASSPSSSEPTRSSRPEWPLMPPHFQVRRVERLTSGVVVEGQAQRRR